MPPLTLKDRRSQTIDRILKAATKEFSEAGFAGARVDEIANRAGVNKATIYYHIGDKQALYAQVVHHLLHSHQPVRNGVVLVVILDRNRFPQKDLYRSRYVHNKLTDSHS